MWSRLSFSATPFAQHLPALHSERLTVVVGALAACATTLAAYKRQVSSVSSCDSFSGPIRKKRIIKALRDSRFIIFDKDGTLSKCDKAFGPWTNMILQSLEQLGLTRNAKDLGERLDFCIETNTFGPKSPFVRETAERSIFACAAAGYHSMRGCNSNDIEAGRYVGEHFQLLDADEAYTSWYHRFYALTSDHGVFKMDYEKFLTVETVEFCGRDTLELLELLRYGDSESESGAFLGILTSDERRSTQKQLDVLGLNAYFDARLTICAGDAALTMPKPAPDGILLLCERVGLSPAEVVMVGDSFTDLLAGIRAGCKKLVFVHSSGISHESLAETVTNWEIQRKERLDVVRITEEIRDPLLRPKSKAVQILSMPTIDFMMCE